MTLVDIILLAILGYFIFRGARVGFIKLIGGFAGIIIGAWAAGQFYEEVAQWMLLYFDVQIMIAIVVSFIAIYLAVNIIVGLIVRGVTSVFKIIPLATTTNRLIGALLGLLQGMLLIGLIIWAINLYPFENKVARTLDESRVAGWYTYSTQLVQPLLPESLRDVDFTVLQDLQEFSDEKAEYIRQNMPKFFDSFEKQRDEFQERIDQELEANDAMMPGAEAQEMEDTTQSQQTIDVI